MKRKSKRSHNKKRKSKRSRSYNKKRKSRRSTSYKNLKCPKGKIKVKRFSRSRKNSSNKSFVKPYCRKDVGKPGKTPPNKKTLPKPGTDISLVKMGYSAYDPKSKRQNVLRRASKKYGYLTVLRHLNLRANYQQWNKKVYNNMREDVKYLSMQYQKLKKI